MIRFPLAFLLLLASLFGLDLATGGFLCSVMISAVVAGNLGGINLAAETPITLAEAARTLLGGPVHVSTIHRWRLKGVRGVRLETFLRGGVRQTTREAIERFFAATTAAADGDTPPARTSRQRECDISRAEREATEAGI